MIHETKDTILEYETKGNGPPVVLIHSTASSLHQWKALIDKLEKSFTLISVNLYGYGLTSKWSKKKGPQVLLDQVNLFKPLLKRFDEPISFIGHSYGGSIAMRAALEYQDKIKNLILLEPNPFFLFDREKQPNAYSMSRNLGETLKICHKNHDWERFAEIFLKFWIGNQAWPSMSEKKQQGFLKLIPNIYHEAEGIFSEKMCLKDFVSIQKKILLVSAKDTNLVTKEIVKLFIGELPEITNAFLPEGGHMAPITCPQTVNSIIYKYLMREYFETIK